MRVLDYRDMIEDSAKSNQGDDTVDRCKIFIPFRTRRKCMQAKHKRQGEINKERERLEGRLPLGSPQVCLLIILLAWLRDFDKGSDCSLKVAASHEPQKQAAGKTSRKQRGRKLSSRRV